MKVTGYTLREAIKIKNIELSSLSSQFTDSLQYFENEEKPNPIDIANKIVKLESDLSLLQTFQSWYNLNVTVELEGNIIPLETAVKLIGGLSRQASQWRSAAGRSEASMVRFSRTQNTRSKDDLIAKPSITKSEALSLTKEAEKRCSNLRTKIAMANSNERTLPFENIDSTLFA